MVEKCENEPKLFYKYINEKMKSTETIDKIVKGRKTYQPTEELSEIMSESFKRVFTEEEAFTEPSMIEAREGFEEVVVQKQDVGRLMGSLDVRKAIGPDEVSGWTLRECKVTNTANLGSDYQLTRGGEGTTRVEEGQHSAHLQRRKED